MNIVDALESLERPVATIEPTAALSIVIATFVRDNVSSIVVVNDQCKPLGVITHRSVIRSITDCGPVATTFLATDLMQYPTLTCGPDETLEHAIEFMIAWRARHLVVLIDGTILGTLSIGDMVKVRIRIAEPEAGIQRELQEVGRT